MNQTQVDKKSGKKSYKQRFLENIRFSKISNNEEETKSQDESEFLKIGIFHGTSE